MHSQTMFFILFLFSLVYSVESERKNDKFSIPVALEPSDLVQQQVKQFVALFSDQFKDRDTFDGGDAFGDQSDVDSPFGVQKTVSAVVPKAVLDRLEQKRSQCSTVYSLIRLYRPRSVVQLTQGQFDYEPWCTGYALAGLRDNDSRRSAHLFTVLRSETAVNRTRRFPTNPALSGSAGSLVRRPDDADYVNKLRFYWHPVLAESSDQLHSLLSFAGNPYDLIVVDPDTDRDLDAAAARPLDPGLVSFLTGDGEGSRASLVRLLLPQARASDSSSMLLLESELPAAVVGSDPLISPLCLVESSRSDDKTGLLELRSSGRWLLGRAPRPLSYVVSYYGQAADLLKLVSRLRKLPDLLRRSVSLVVVDDGYPDEELHAGRLLQLVPASDVEDLDVRVFRVDRDLTWNVGGARNLGTYVAQSPWVFHTDMDILFTQTDRVDQGLGFLMAQALSDSTYRGNYKLAYRHGATGSGTHAGTMFCWRDFYWENGGCDEDFVGTYGFTDIHFDFRSGPSHRSLSNRRAVVEIWEPVENNTARLDRIHGIGRKSYKINERRLKRKKAFDQWTLPMIRFPWHYVSITQKALFKLSK